MAPVRKRFERKFSAEPTSGCWLWEAARHGNGRYGMMWDGHGYASAHRVAWELYRGPIPEGKCVLHKCDNGLCVNPDHLFLGTQADNVQDMICKGRKVVGLAGQHNNHAKGERNGSARYSDEVISAMREDYDTGVKNIAGLARRYSVSESQTRRIVWRQSRV